MGTWLVFAALMMAPACSTVSAEIHGPRVGIGFELDHDLRVSPRFELGYDYDRYNNAFGYGGSVGMAWAPLVGRLEAILEGRLLAFPLFGMPISPLALGSVAAWSRADGWTVGVRSGIGTLMYMPGDACVPPIDGEFDGCPEGVPTLESVVQRPWLPRIDFRVSVLFSVEGRKGPTGAARTTIIHYLGFAMTDALWNLMGAAPP